MGPSISWVIILYIMFSSLKKNRCSDYEMPCKQNSYFCSGDVLQKVQMSGIFNDSKTFVDMPLRKNWTKRIEEDILSARNKGQLRLKIKKYFYPAGTREMHSENIPDWKPNPKFLDKIHDGNYKEWAKNLCGLWSKLVRKINKDVHVNNQTYSLVYLEELLVVPGGRFREIYYWDTYWSLEGLLHCEMYTTAKKVLENLLQLVKLYGFIPNGGRKYYENRSQPPFLTLMVLKYYDKTHDSSFVERNHKLLMKEYNFWMKNRVATVTNSMNNFTLNVYGSKLGYPRPESYKEDKEIVRKAGYENDTSLQQEMYSHIASAAESGWDFSSRWFGDFKTMTTIKTRDIVPVDLNSILCAVEYTLAFFAEILANEPMTAMLLKKAIERRAAIDAVFWDEEQGLWFDYDRKEKKLRKQFYASSLFPLWIDNFNRLDTATRTDSRRKEKVYNGLYKLGVLSYPGGLPTSLINSGQQWDFPNVWAPLQHVAVYAFDNAPIHVQEGGKELAKKFLENAYLAWRRRGHMFEKYNAQHPGQAGHGGEYDIQLGFGWTNGVVLDFLDKYGKELTSPTTPKPLMNASYSESHSLFLKDTVNIYTFLILVCYVVVILLAHIWRSFTLA